MFASLTMCSHVALVPATTLPTCAVIIVSAFAATIAARSVVHNGNVRGHIRSDVSIASAPNKEICEAREMESV